MAARLTKILRDARGAAAIEYGLIVGLIVLAIVAALSAVGSSNNGGWGNVSGKVGNAMPTS